MRMKQREILNAISLDFKRDNQSQEQFLDAKIAQIKHDAREYLLSVDMKGYLLGLSGGIDSYASAALLADATHECGKEIRLLLLPNHTQADIADSQECAAALTSQFSNVTVETVSIGKANDGMIAEIAQSELYNSKDRYSVGNIQARLRMVTQYALARGYLVAGTDHATENVVGYFTKYGDGGTDFNPIDGLLKPDIYEIAARYQAPACVMQKAPAAGLGISSCDEEELGMTYAELASYLRGNLLDKSKCMRIRELYDRSEHKRHLPASPMNLWWKERPSPVTHIVVDMLHDFIDGTMACENAQNAVEATASFINAHPEMRVLYVRDYHPADHCSFLEQDGPWPAHCVEGTPGAELCEAFYNLKKTTNTPLLHYNIFDKGTSRYEEQYSGFDAENAQYGALKYNLTPRVVVSGIATEYCVRETVLQLIQSGFQVSVVKDALAWVDAEAHAETLGEFEAFGVKLI